MTHKRDIGRDLATVATSLTVVFPLLLLSNVLSDIALCIIAVCFIAYSRLRMDWSWLKEGWMRALLLLWLYMCLRAGFANSPGEALARAAPFGRYILFAAALARWTLRDEKTRVRFWALLLAAVIAFACDGLLQYIKGSDVLGHPLIHDPNTGHIRLSGPFSRPILGIMLAWLMFPVLLPLLFNARSMLKKGNALIRAAMSLLIVLAAIALSGERMALLLTVAGLVLTMTLMRLRLAAALWGCAGVIVLMGALVLASPDMAARQVNSTGETLRNWPQSAYGLLLKSDWAVAEIDPVFGLGAGNFRVACAELYPGNAAKITAMCNTHPHNIYLEWLIEEGVIGLTLFTCFVLLVLKDALRVCLSAANSPALCGLLIAFIVRVWPLMTTTGFFSRWGAPPFWLVAGALIFYIRGKGEKDAGTSLSVQDARL